MTPDLMQQGAGKNPKDNGKPVKREHKQQQIPGVKTLNENHGALALGNLTKAESLELLKYSSC